MGGGGGQPEAHLHAFDDPELAQRPARPTERDVVDFDTVSDDQYGLVF